MKGAMFGVTFGLLASVASASAQERQPATDAYLDPTARILFEAAKENWRSLDQTILRYTARIDQRIALALRTPLKDRILYRNETAVRAFWDQDYPAVVQVLGTHSQYPGRSIAVREGDLDWVEDLPFDEPFEPGGDRLFFGLTDDVDEEVFQPSNEDFWLAHPLADGSDTLYQFASGDTLTLSLPDGRRLRAIQLDVLPREADVHRISGTLWIEPETGALVRAVYRLSQSFDVMRDVPEVRNEAQAGEFDIVPGLFKPWTFDLTMIAVDYSLWDFKLWLPRTMRMEGQVAAGILKMPISMDVSYQIESVTTDEGVTSLTEDPNAALEDVHFETRGEAMAFIAQLLSGGDQVAYEQMDDSETAARERESLLIVPQDRTLIADNPNLPPPIWKEAAAFPSDEQLEEYVGILAKLPAPPIQGIPWSAHWGWARPDLVRYNRVEGPAIGGRFEATLGGFYTADFSGFFGFADLQPKVRVDLQRSSVRRRLTLGAYRALVATDPAGGHLGFGNSVDALLFGRDNGEYFRTTGTDFTWRPPVGKRSSFLFRGYAERQELAEREINFALFKVFDGDWGFRPNMVAEKVDEGGAELTVSPWWGGDPLGAQFGLEFYGHGAYWRSAEDALDGASALEVDGASALEEGDYLRASVIARSAFPIGIDNWRVGLEAGAGSTWGEAPLQRSWFLGSASTLRGFPPSVIRGSSFVRGRIEAARTFEAIGAVSVFGDVGWAGLRSDFDSGDLLYGVGVGGSILDGIFRMDFSHGLNGPLRQFRLDLYLDAIL